MLLEHDIRIKKNTAKKCQKASFVEAEVGQDMQDVLVKAASKNQLVRKAAEQAVSNGECVERVSHKLSAMKKTESPRDKLIKEKERIEKTISALTQRLDVIVEQLAAA